MASSRSCHTPVPGPFVCPISLDLMTDPVTLSSGITFDRESIRDWFAAGHRTCPVTRQSLSAQDPVPNHTLRRIIHSWCLANAHVVSSSANAVPITKLVSETAPAEVWTSYLQRPDLLLEHNPARGSALAQLVPVLASTVSSDGSKSMPEKFYSLRVHEEIAAALSRFHLTDDDISLLAQPKVVSCIGWLLSNDKCEVNLNVVQLLGKLLEPESKRTTLLQSIGAHLPEVAERLVKSIRSSPGIMTDPDVLNTLHFLCSSRRVLHKMIDLGLVEIAIHQLLSEINFRVRVYENTLALLDTLLSCAEGRAAASQNVLFIPGIVKRLFMVSKAATECAVNVLWKMCRHSYDDQVRYQAVKARLPAKLNQLLLQVYVCPEAQRRGRRLSKLLREYKQQTRKVEKAPAPGNR